MKINWKALADGLGNMAGGAMQKRRHAGNTQHTTGSVTFWVYPTV
nr:MAG TPA: Mastoparan protein [Caudoviricetes sp.]